MSYLQTPLDARSPFFGPGGFPCVTRGGVAMHTWPLLLPTLVSLSFSLRLLLLIHFGGTPVCENLFPPSGSKARDGERKKKERRKKVGNNNGQVCIATPPRVAHAKPHGPISKSKSSVPGQNVRASKINKPFTEAFRLVIYSF